MGKRAISAHRNSGAASTKDNHNETSLSRSIRKRTRSRPIVSAALKTSDLKGIAKSSTINNTTTTLGSTNKYNSSSNFLINNDGGRSDYPDGEEQDSSRSSRSDDTAEAAQQSPQTQQIIPNSNNNSNSNKNIIKDSSNGGTYMHTLSLPNNNRSEFIGKTTINGGGEETGTSMGSPKPVYSLRPSIVNGTVVRDLIKKPWRLGRPIGKGNFGEIFLASDNINVPVTIENAKFVAKIEPHLNGPLFVEIHCLMNTARKPNSNEDDDDNSNEEDNDDESNSKEALNGGKKKQQYHEVDNRNVPQIAPSGIPDYIASGSHCFNGVRYRFLVLPRFDRDLYSLIKNCRVHEKSILTLAIQIVNVLENLHDKGYCHNDVKAQNLMISKCKYFKRKLTTMSSRCAINNNNNNSHTMKKGEYVTRNLRQARQTRKFYNDDDQYEKEKQPTTDSGNSSEQEVNFDLPNNKAYISKRFRYNNDGDDDDYDDEGEDSNEDDDEMDESNDDDDESDEENDQEEFDEDSNSTSHNFNNNYQTPLNRKEGSTLTRKHFIQFSGSNPIRTCRRREPNIMYDEMVKSHYLRPTKRISYSEFFNDDGMRDNSDLSEVERSSSEESDDIKLLDRKLKRPVKRTTRHQQEHIQGRRGRRGGGVGGDDNTTTTTVVPELVTVEEERIFLIDFGLASKFMYRNGNHRPFVMDQRRAHDGTLEFTSRDAHMGAHSRRSDLECLGYNLLFWSQGYLPWKEAAAQQQQEKVHRAKEYLMIDVREMLKQVYGKMVPKYLGEFLHQVGQLSYHERPDYARYRRIFEREFQQLDYSTSELRLDSNEIARTCIRFKDELGIRPDIFDTSKPHHQVWNVMSNVSVGTPFQDRSFSSRVSPKNLRSKSESKTSKKKKFSWAEVLSQDPDQIARERAEKEFEREESLNEPPLRRFEGNPTYAILAARRYKLRVSGAASTVVGKTMVKDESQMTDVDANMEVDEDSNTSSFNHEQNGHCRVKKSSNEVNSIDTNGMNYENGEENDDDDDDNNYTEIPNHRLHNGNGNCENRKSDKHSCRKYRKRSKETLKNGSSGKKSTSIIKNRRTKAKCTAVLFTTKTRRTAKTKTTTTTASTLKSSSKTIRGRGNTNKRRSSNNKDHYESSPISIYTVDQQHAASASEIEQRKHQNGLTLMDNSNQMHSNGDNTKRNRRNNKKFRMKKSDSPMDDTDMLPLLDDSKYNDNVHDLFNVWKKVSKNHHQQQQADNGVYYKRMKHNRKY